MSVRSSGFILLFILINSLSFSQSSREKKILLRIDTMKINTDEFIYALNKNNYSKEKINKKNIDEYLELYINFKLKVREAYSLGNDTSDSFIREYNVYKNQLEDSYLRNDNWLDSLTREIYERLKYEIRASHILINVKDLLDTLTAYQKIEKVYQLAQSGISFSKLAIEYSDDPSAHYNEGDLGYFTSFQLVLPFEDMAYNTPVSKISMPFRTKYGYHILKVIDKHPNPGTVSVAHILLRFTQGMTKSDSLKIEQFAQDIYLRLQDGQDWNKLCSSYSEDYNTRNNGGLLPTFGVGRMIPSFAEAAFSLKNPEDISKPVQTPYGWHIIKLIEKKPFRSYDEMHTELMEQVRQDERYALVQKKYIEQLASENFLSLDDNVLGKCLATGDLRLTDGKWKYEADSTLLSVVLMKIKTENYCVKDFFTFIYDNEKPVKNFTPQQYMNKLFSDYKEKKLLDYERTHLAIKYPDYLSRAIRIPYCCLRIA